MYAFIALCLIHPAFSSSVHALGEQPVAVLGDAMKQPFPDDSGLPHSTALLHLPRLTVFDNERGWISQRLMLQMKHLYDSATVKWLLDLLDYHAIKQGAN